MLTVFSDRIGRGLSDRPASPAVEPQDVRSIKKDCQMNHIRCDRRKRVGLLTALFAAALPGLVGCQVDVGGQTLPSPYWQQDDVQYFPPGTEFKLSREAAAMQAAAADAAAGGAATMP